MLQIWWQAVGRSWSVGWPRSVDWRWLVVGELAWLLLLGWLLGRESILIKNKML